MILQICTLYFSLSSNLFSNKYMQRNTVKYALSKICKKTLNT